MTCRDLALLRYEARNEQRTEEESLKPRSRGHLLEDGAVYSGQERSRYREVQLLLPVLLLEPWLLTMLLTLRMVELGTGSVLFPVTL